MASRLSDAVGHLSIEIVGRAEAATKVGEGVNIVEDLTIDFISGMFAVDPFSLLDAHCSSPKRLVATDKEFLSLLRSSSE